MSAVCTVILKLIPGEEKEKKEEEEEKKKPGGSRSTGVLKSTRSRRMERTFFKKKKKKKREREKRGHVTQHTSFRQVGIFFPDRQTDRQTREGGEKYKKNL